MLKARTCQCGGTCQKSQLLRKKEVGGLVSLSRLCLKGLEMLVVANNTKQKAKSYKTLTSNVKRVRDGSLFSIILVN